MPENAPKSPISDDFLSEVPDLTDTQLAAIDLLVLRTPLGTIASELQINRKTLYRWRTQDPHFIAYLNFRRQESHGQITDHYRSLMIDTLNILFKLAKDPIPPTAHKAAHSLIALSRIGYHLAPQPIASPPRRGQSAAPPRAVP